MKDYKDMTADELREFIDWDRAKKYFDRCLNGSGFIDGCFCMDPPHGYEVWHRINKHWPKHRFHKIALEHLAAWKNTLEKAEK